MQILYVEDNRLDADMIKREFKRTAPDIMIEWVATYKEAIARLGRCTAESPLYDLVLTDMKLPDGNGLALIPFIRDRLLPISIVVITGVGNEETAVAALKAGASDYVVKSKDYLARLPVILANSRDRFHDEYTRFSRPLHVLYAEWEAADIDLTRRHLVKYAPYISLEIVGTAQEILHRLSSDCKSAMKDGHPCDVLLLDFHLPGMSGLELLKELNETTRLDLPVVIITGHGDEEVALQAMRLGAMDYVVKNEGYLFHLPIVIENAYHRARTASGQKTLEAYQEQLRSLASEISFVEERERHKIATALHDQVGQPLAMAGIKLEGLRRAVVPGIHGEQVAEILDMINHAIRYSRSLTFELSPPILYELGLEAAICSLAERFHNEHGIRIDCSDDHNPKPLSEDMRILLFQGVRELLVNAVKHARPRRIAVSCQREGSNIRVMVENDGDGFATAEEEASRGHDCGFGLFSLRERLKYLGGSIAIKSVPGQCTQIFLTAPLAKEQQEGRTA